MIDANYQVLAKRVLPEFNAYLSRQIIKDVPNALLAKSMVYSIAAGGKRIRPLLYFAAVETFGGKIEEKLFPIAGAIELMHTYSLIHDDLPAMDNDDLRRGKPTNHKVFGDAVAILAGDGLQSLAYEWLVSANLDSEVTVKLVKALASASGPKGMVSGQVTDMAAENKVLNYKEVKKLHLQKTGALFAASLAMGALTSNVKDPLDVSVVAEIGSIFGYAFQIQDDINDMTLTAAKLGKTPNKDLAEGKNTIPGLMGLDGSKHEITKLMDTIKDRLAGISLAEPELDGEYTIDVSLLLSFTELFTKQGGPK